MIWEIALLALMGSLLAIWMLPRQRQPAPGSAEAVAAGCRCPQLDNHYGAGVPGLTDGEGKPVYWISAECPIHGSDATPQGGVIGAHLT